MDFDSPAVTCRPALPSDKEDVIEFCKGIWDGHDYIPEVWDEWMADSKGHMLVAEYGGHAVGLTRMTYLAPSQWWFEGMRVDPAHQDKRIGSLLNDYLNRYFEQHGNGQAGLITNSENYKVHHMVERNGFVKVGERTMFIASPIDEPTDSFSPVEPAALNKAVTFAQNAPSLALQNDVMEAGWRYAPPNIDSFKDITTWEAENGRALWWRGRDGLLLCWEDNWDDIGRGLVASLFACTNADLPALLADSQRLAAQSECNKACAFVFLGSEMQSTLEDAGFARRSDRSAFYYVRQHPTHP